MKPGSRTPVAVTHPVTMPSNALAQRVVTAVVLVAVLLPAFLLLPKGFGLALIAAFVLLAAWEWSGFIGATGPAVRFLYVIGVAAVVAAAELAVPGFLPMSAVAAASLIWWSVAFVCILRFPVTVGRLAVLACGVLVLLPAWLSLVALLYTRADGRKLLLLALAIV